MKQVVYLSGAEADIDDIWEYTFAHWDMAQADAYIRQITSTCNGLASGTLQGRSAEDVRSGYLKRVAGSHVIFYQETPDSIVIYRILHRRMDMSSHFDDEPPSQR